MITLSRSGSTVSEQRVYRPLTRISFKTLFALFTLLLAISGVVLPTPPAHAARASAEPLFRYFAATGHNLSGQFKAFYDRNGGEAIFGLPITEIVADGDVSVQYFERARMEMRQHGITFALIGRAVTEGRSDAAFTWLTESPAPDWTFYPQSGHTLGGAFGVFWQAHGSVPIFGYPISEEFLEGERLVQYFERARFEYHPELAPSDVQISQLGRTYVQRIGIPAQLLAPAPPIATLAEATITIPASAQHNVALAARQIDGTEIAPGAVLSFLNTIGEVSTRQGYEPGQAIVDGAVGSSVGGGICYVSTALYRAAFLAGLDIVERHPHSLALASLSDMPGFDAAVDTRGPDLRWHNDTPHPIFVSAELSGPMLTVALWGQGDGRTTTLRGPTVRKAPGAQLMTMSRVVVDANGKVIRSDIVQSRYAVVRTSARTNARSARN
jgi:hypothetical protein